MNDVNGRQMLVKQRRDVPNPKAAVPRMSLMEIGDVRREL